MDAEKHRSMTRTVQYGMTIFLVMALVVTAIGVRILTKDIPLPERKNAPVLTRAPRVGVGGSSVMNKQSDEQVDPDNQPAPFFTTPDGRIVAAQPVRTEDVEYSVRAAGSRAPSASSTRPIIDRNAGSQAAGTRSMKPSQFSF